MTTSKTERLAQWSAIATAIIATLGLGIAMWQIQAAEKSQREASAREAFKEYLKLAIDKPEFADARLEVVSKTESGKSSYAWFVSYFMYSAEQIFQSFPNDPEWNRALSDQVCYHKVYLTGAEYQTTLRMTYAPDFATFVDAFLKGCTL
jgi:hypothetical protein